ncbi:hypothetical protein cypCar_00046206, partial [Cyprinus carpio]
MVSVPVDLESVILRTKSALLQNVRQCGATPVNETTVCGSTNSSVVSAYLGSSHDGGRLCEFSITQYACAQLTDLSSQDLATVLSCGLDGNDNVSEETWKLFTQKVNPVLGPALDLLADTTQGVVLPSPVQEAVLQQVFDRANLTTLPDADLQIWILNILPSFIANITVQHVTSYFSIVQQRPCPISQQAVQLLNSSSSTFQPETQDQIYQLILGSLTGPAPLRCYGNQSYYAFLSSSFMSFQFPNLTTFLSLMPPARVPELMESVSPAEVSSLLNRPNAVDDVTQICQLFRNYPKTPQYLQT